MTVVFLKTHVFWDAAPYRRGYSSRRFEDSSVFETSEIPYLRDTASPWRRLEFSTSFQLNNLFQMKPTRCTLLFSIFISTSLRVSGNCVPIIRRTYCIYATLVFFSLCVGGCLVCCSRQPPIVTVSSPDDGNIVARNMQRSWNKYTEK